MHVHNNQDRLTLLNTLVLIKHAMPSIDKNLPASAWHLSEAGQDKCEALSKHLIQFFPAKVYASEEPKAIETALLSTSSYSSNQITTDGRLNEHIRETYKFQSQNQFETHVKEFFDKPDKLIFGEETADQAFTRFAEAIAEILSNRNPARDSLVFSHGTVISLWVSRKLEIAPFPLWKRLTLPSYIEIKQKDPPEFELVAIR